MTGPVPVLLVCAEARRDHLTREFRRAPDLALAQVVTLAGRAASAAAHLGGGVLVLDAGVEGGAVAVVVAVMASAPLPILVLGEGLRGAEVDALLAAGAVEVRRGAGTGGLAERCRVLAGVGVVRRRPRPRVVPAPPDRGPGTGTVLAVGASTGGPPALATLLAGLAGIAVPVLVVQHIAADFLPALATWLADTGPLPVNVAREGEALRPGEVHLAPGGQHLRLQPGGRLALTCVPASLHVPSVDVLFSSVAACPDVRGVGVLLTGMGGDGARGLLDLRAAGGRTLVQDEATCTVYGMPRAAVELGAAEQVVPMPRMAEEVLALLAGVTT